jgi:hypothetical protein
MRQELKLQWLPPGPVAQGFMFAKKRVQIINGPVGSGKTTACCMKSILYASRQRTSNQDNKTRKTKVCIVRDTYRQLWKTTLPSWWKRIPKEAGEFQGSTDGPATHRIQFELEDRTICDLQMDFIAIGENNVEDVMRGYEPTLWYLNEADLLSREVYTFAKGRWGRFPDMSEGGPSWWGILMDCNAPELTSWLYTEIFKNTPDDVDLFRQPGGREPGAENLHNLPADYYIDQAKGQPLWYIKRMIDNAPGFSRAGKPVYAEYQDTIHVARTPLEFAPWRKLIIGLDAGLSPAAAFLQRMPNGQWRCLREIATIAGTGPIRFGQLLALTLKENYPNLDGQKIVCYADPSAQHGNDKDDGEMSWIEIVSFHAGLTVLPAPTNALIPRLEAVRKPLMTLIDGEPAFLLDPNLCPVLREGFNSGYRFKKLPLVDIERYSEEPEKTPHSHPHDALQYGMSAEGEDLEIRGRHASEAERTASATHVHDWDPFAMA